MEDFRQYGFPYPEELVMSFIGGSQLHGAKLEGKDDTDWYGVFIETPEHVIGLESYDHFVVTTGGQRGGNRPSDVDVCLYSLRKWAKLAAKGNPSVLHFLFAKAEFATDSWKAFAADPSPFLARTHVKSFLGFANEQLRKLLSHRGMDVNRPYLVQHHGYDTKYAMHLIRLFGEARELMETGRISLPRPNAEELVAIRNGRYTLAELTELAQQLEQEALAASERSNLPEFVDREKITKLLTCTHQAHWELRLARKT